MRFQFPRARGASSGRAPQIGPGTLEGRTMNLQLQRPGDFSVIAYAPDDSDPDTEYWCFLRPGAGGPGTTDFDLLDDGSTLWLDLVPTLEAFHPAGGNIESELKLYAAQRYLLKLGGTTNENDWKVSIAHPNFFTPVATSPRKLSPGIFEVVQEELPSGNNRTAWVWVTSNGGREIWLLYRPDEPGGFNHVGRISGSTGQICATSEFFFTRINGANGPDNVVYTSPTGDVNVTISVTNLALALYHLKEMARWRGGNPAVLDPATDIRVDDFRVQEQI